MTETGTAGGPTYVLVHGLGVSARYFRPLAQLLAREGRVFAPDLPGFGRSPRPEHPLSVPDLAHVVAGLIRDRGLVTPVLVGHSMGAQVVTELAATHPGLVARMILLGPVVNTAERTAVWQAARLVQDAVREPLPLNALLTVDYLRCGTRWYAATVAQMLAYRIDQRLPQVTAPVVVVRGQHDPIAPRGWIRELAEIAPRATEVEVDGAGHVVMYTRPAAVAALCREETS